MEYLNWVRSLLSTGDTQNKRILVLIALTVSGETHTGQINTDKHGDIDEDSYYTIHYDR